MSEIKGDNCIAQSDSTVLSAAQLQIMSLQHTQLNSTQQELTDSCVKHL